MNPKEIHLKKGNRPSRPSPTPKREESPAKGRGPFYARQMNWWLLLLLVLPFVFSRNAMDPIFSSRLVFLSAWLVLYLLWFHVVRTKHLAIDPLRQRATRVLAILALGFVATQVVTSVTAASPQEALPSCIRFFLASLITLLFALTVMREGDLLPGLCRALTFVLLAQSLIAVFQQSGLAFTDIPPVEAPRPYGFMSSRNLMASFLALLFPFSACLFLTGSRPWRLAAGLTMVLAFCGIVVGQTRSAWLSLATGLVVSSVLIFLVRRRLPPAVTKLWFGGLALLVAGTLVVLGLSLALPGQRDLAVSLKHRVAALGQLSDNASAAQPATGGRLYFWRTSLKMIRDRPLFGVGPGNWRVMVQRYGINEGLTAADGVWAPDHAHNDYVQMAAESGIPGLLLYLGIWGTLGFITANVIRQAADFRRNLLAIFCLAGLCTYAVDSGFSFPNDSLAHSLVLAFLCAIPIGLHELAARSPTAAQPGGSVSRAWVLPVVALLCFCIYLGYVRENFESHVRRAFNRIKDRQYEAVLGEVEAGRHPLMGLCPMGFPLDYHGALAYEGLRRYDQALEAVRRARRLAPANLFVEYRMGLIYAELSRWDEAIAQFQAAFRLDSKYDPVRRSLAEAYHKKGMYRECRALLSATNCLTTPYYFDVLASANLQLQDFASAAAVYRAGLNQFTNSTDMLEKLAYLEYIHLKDPTNACEHFQRLLALQPDHPKREEYTRVINYLAPRVGKKPGGGGGSQ